MSSENRVQGLGIPSDQLPGASRFGRRPSTSGVEQVDSDKTRDAKTYLGEDVQGMGGGHEGDHETMPPIGGLKGNRFTADVDRGVLGPPTDWEKRAGSYLGSWVTQREYINVICEAGELSYSHDVLSVAGGGGYLETVVANRVRRVDVADLSKGMLKEAGRCFAERGNPNGEQLWLYQADAIALPFPSNSYDRTIIRSALHHMEDPELAIAEMVRVTKPGGLVILSDGTPPSVDPEVVEHYRRVFSHKERRRIVFDRDLGYALFDAGIGDVKTSEYWMRDVSVAEWLAHSGLDEEAVKKIFIESLGQSRMVREAYGTVFVLNDNSTVDELPDGYVTILDDPEDPKAVADILGNWRFVNVVGRA